VYDWCWSPPRLDYVGGETIEQHDLLYTGLKQLKDCSFVDLVKKRIMTLENNLDGVRGCLRSLTSSEPFEHEADGRHVDEGFRSLDLQLVVFAQATISAQPRKRALHDSKSGPPP
jgi:hypothetical protein